jgi:hypothetical protein
MANHRQTKFRSNCTAVSIFLLVVSVLASKAELSPAIYKEMQKNAPELLEIEVLSVTTRETADEILVEVESRVKGVTRSKSGLKVGDVIRIDYSRRIKPLVGPSPVPLLEKKKSYPAFLTLAREKTYQPAAGAKSFSVIE